MKTQDVDNLLVLLEAIANSRVRALEMPDGSVRSELEAASIPHLKFVISLLFNFVARLDGVSAVDEDRLKIVDQLDLRDAREGLEANRWRLVEMRADEEKGFTSIASWIFHAAAFLPIARKGRKIVLAIAEPEPRRGTKVQRCLAAMTLADERTPGLFVGWTDQRAVEWAKNNGHPISLGSLQRRSKNRDVWLSLKNGRRAR